MNRLSAEGLEPLLDQLQTLDPNYYNEVDRKNPKRIVHALEVCLTTGKPFSELRTNKIQNRPFKIIKIGLNCDRAILHNRINDRVDKMFKDGLEIEAKELYEFRNLNSLNTVGYRELFDYFDGTITLAQASEKIKANTRKYARKQLTWFRRDPEITWFSPDQKGEILSYLKSNLVV
jgi:tRNA dimethylallyltransferase